MLKVKDMPTLINKVCCHFGRCGNCPLCMDDSIQLVDSDEHICVATMIRMANKRIKAVRKKYKEVYDL